MLTGSSMGARLAVEECFKWAMQRKVHDSNTCEPCYLTCAFMNIGIWQAIDRSTSDSCQIGKDGKWHGWMCVRYETSINLQYPYRLPVSKVFTVGSKTSHIKCAT